MTNSERSAARRKRLREAGICVICGRNPARPERTSCATCGRDSTRAKREKYRAAHDIPLDAPIGAWRQGGQPRCRICGEIHHDARTCPARPRADLAWQCLRCREPHAPGSDLCADHLATMAELQEGA